MGVPSVGMAIAGGMPRTTPVDEGVATGVASRGAMGVALDLTNATGMWHGVSWVKSLGSMDYSRGRYGPDGGWHWGATGRDGPWVKAAARWHDGQDRTQSTTYATGDAGMPMSCHRGPKRHGRRAWPCRCQFERGDQGWHGWMARGREKCERTLQNSD